MKTLISVVLCLVIFLLGLIGGFFVSEKFNTDSQNDTVASQNDIVQLKNDVVGTYKAVDWYDYEAVIVLYSDGTCIYPTRTAYSEGEWSIENGKINMTAEHDATIVPQGIIYKNIFFQKI